MIVDLFAGPGGWDVGAADLGLTPLGIETDVDTVKTRHAAGLRTLQGDVATLDPLGFAPVEGLIASPPCTAFSNAGDRLGILDVPLVYEAVQQLDRGDYVDVVTAHPTSLLVVEPLRWALALRPTWIALEQVPPVLDLWHAIAEVLRRHGWSAWAGVLNAADYGVPQVRKRAILVAHREKTAHPPAPTHTEGGAVTLLEELAPWVTMAQALGWDAGGTVQHRRSGERLEEEHSADRPSDSVTSRVDRWHVGFPRRADTPSNRAGDGVVDLDGTEYRERLFPADGPAQTVTEKARSWQRWQLNPGKTESQPNRRLWDPEEEPAPTVAFGHDAAGWAWERPAPTLTGSRRSDEGGLVGRQLPDGEGRNVGGRNWPTHVNTGRDWKEGGDREDAQLVPVDEPAPTIDGKGRWRKVYDDGDPDWPEQRPATTVQGDSRIWAPGHKENAADPPGKYQQRRGDEAIRVTLEEAATLQGFPPDYPWQGNKSSRFRQVGNAVPPPLARAILAELL